MSRNTSFVKTALPPFGALKLSRDNNRLLDLRFVKTALPPFGALKHFSKFFASCLISVKTALPPFGALKPTTEINLTG